MMPASIAIAATIGPTLIPTLGIVGGMRVNPSSSVTGWTMPDQVSYAMPWLGMSRYGPVDP